MDLEFTYPMEIKIIERHVTGRPIQNGSSIQSDPNGLPARGGRNLKRRDS